MLVCVSEYAHVHVIVHIQACVFIIAHYCTHWYAFQHTHTHSRALMSVLTRSSAHKRIVSSALLHAFSHSLTPPLSYFPVCSPTHTLILPLSLFHTPNHPSLAHSSLLLAYCVLLSLTHSSFSHSLPCISLSSLSPLQLCLLVPPSPPLSLFLPCFLTRFLSHLSFDQRANVGMREQEGSGRVSLPPAS